MFINDAPSVQQLEEQERRLVLPSFDATDAWMLGSFMREAVSASPAVLNIQRPNATLFHTALAGAVPDNEAWARRKAAAVFRFEASSLLVRLRLEAIGVVGDGEGWFDPTQLVLAGGSVPIRVNGVGVVAAATASGLDEAGDHNVVVHALERLLAHHGATADRSAR